MKTENMFQARFWWAYLLIALLVIILAAAINFGSNPYTFLWIFLGSIILFILTGLLRNSRFGLWIRGILYPLILLIIIGLMFHGTSHLINGGFLKATCGISDSSFYQRGWDDGNYDGYYEGLNVGEEICKKEKKSLQFTIDSLQALLADCQPIKKVVNKTKSSPTPKTKTTPKPDIPLRNDFAPPSTKISGGFQDSMSVDMTKYGPVFAGEYGTTTSIELTIDQAYVMYYVQDEAIKKMPGKITVPEIFGEEMIAYNYQGTKYWVWVNYKEKLTSGIIRDGHLFPWSIYIGVFQGNDFSYPMYWPHEAVKGLMQKVRGKEHDEVTRSDIQEMGKYNPGIAEGTIRPNKRFATGSDGKQYEGWEFHTRINYVIRQ